jgi:excisionase family DNA binding protein
MSCTMTCTECSPCPPALPAENSPPPPRRWLTVKEAADYLTCSDETLRRLRLRGVLTPTKVGVKRLVYDVQDLDKYLESRRPAD